MFFGGVPGHVHDLATSKTIVASPGFGVGNLRTVPTTALFAICEIGINIDPDITELRAVNVAEEDAIGAGTYTERMLAESVAGAGDQRSLRVVFTIGSGRRYYFVQVGTGGVSVGSLHERLVTQATGNPE